MICKRCHGNKYDPEIRSKLQPPPGYMPCRDCNGSGETGFEKLWPDEFIGEDFFPNHCQDVLEGCYDVPFSGKAPIILDIGANVGAFVRWAKGRWPKSTIYCYEPNPTNYSKLLKTIARLLPENTNHYEFDIHPENCAVLNSDGKGILGFDGVNCGEWSLMPALSTSKTKIEVRLISAEFLPKADILKIDAEGAEGIILSTLCNANRLREFASISVEYHSYNDMCFILGMLTRSGFREIGITNTAENRGIMKFVRG